MVAFLSGFVARRRGEHWLLTPEESEGLAVGVAGVFRHVPLPAKQLGIAADVSALALVAYTVAGPRLALDQQIAAARRGQVGRTPAGRMNAEPTVRTYTNGATANPEPAFAFGEPES